MSVDFVFLGFAPVRPYDWVPVEWPFRWVASVKGSRPEGWVDSWNFNQASCWNTEEEAWGVVAPGEERLYRMYAYRLLPVFYREGDEPEPRKLKRIFDYDAIAVPPEPALDGFERLGLDVVGTKLINGGPTIGLHTSPLSTNVMWEETRVNEYCLIDTLEGAIAFAAKCNRELPEPEHFYVVEVLVKPLH